MKKITELSRNIFLILFSSVGLHFFVTFLSLYSAGKQLNSEMYDSVLRTQLTFDMLPVLISYVVLFALIFYLFYKFKRSLEEVNKANIKAAENKAAAEVSRQLTAFAIQYIGRNNYQIINWLREKQKKGSQPLVVAEASNNIGKVLNTLSTVSFLQSSSYSEIGNMLEVEYNAKALE